jgi:hypothetical protein
LRRRVPISCWSCLRSRPVGSDAQAAILSALACSIVAVILAKPMGAGLGEFAAAGLLLMFGLLPRMTAEHCQAVSQVWPSNVSGKADRSVNVWCAAPTSPRVQDGRDPARDERTALNPEGAVSIIVSIDSSTLVATPTMRVQ